jgi:hypothetical protein
MTRIHRCRICNGRGEVQNDKYRLPKICKHCKGSGLEDDMSNNDEEAEVVQCGSKVIQKYSKSYYTSLIEKLEKNCVQGKGIVTFSQVEWDETKAVIKQVESKIEEMSLLTHVTEASGLCKATACQWEVLGKMRDKAEKDAKRLDILYPLVEHVLGIIDNLVENKVLAANEWWTVKAGQIRSKVDDMRRM